MNGVERQRVGGSEAEKRRAWETWRPESRAQHSAQNTNVLGYIVKHTRHQLGGFLLRLRHVRRVLVEDTVAGGCVTSIVTLSATRVDSQTRVIDRGPSEG